MQKTTVVLVATSLLMSCQYQGEPPSIPSDVHSNQSRLVVDACSASGADLGAKINSADATLGGSPGDITVYTCSGNIATQVVLNPGHTLKLAAGLYTTTLDDDVVLMKHDTTVVGSGWQTVFQESSNSPNNFGITIFHAYSDTLDGRTSDANITVRDLQIVAGTGVVSEGTDAAIILGNAHNALVENVFFNTTHAIGVNVGGRGDTGIYADGVTIRNCVFDSLWAVSAALVNGRNVVIEGNRFLGGQEGSNTSYVDLEVNVPSDRVQNFRITNNLFDSSGTVAHRYGVTVYAANDNSGPGLISNNIFVGGVIGGIKQCTSAYAIQVGAENVLVSNNHVKYYCFSGIVLLDTAKHNIVSANSIKFVGDPIISVAGLFNQIVNNISDGYQTSTDGEGYFAQISEVGSADGNSFSGNVLNSYKGTKGGSAWFHSRINLLGAGSVAHNNYIDRTTTSTKSAKVEATKAVTSGYTVLFTDHIVLGNASAGAFTITLSDATNSFEPAVPNFGGGKGRLLVLKSTGSTGSNITVSPVSGQTIDGAASLTLAPLEGVTLLSDGSNWQIINRT